MKHHAIYVRVHGTYVLYTVRTVLAYQPFSSCSPPSPSVPQTLTGRRTGGRGHGGDGAGDGAGDGGKARGTESSVGNHGLARLAPHKKENQETRVLDHSPQCQSCSDLHDLQRPCASRWNVPVSEGCWVLTRSAGIATPSPGAL